MSEAFRSAESVPEILKGMLDFSRLLEKSGADAALVELVKTRVSQVNGIRHAEMRAYDGRDRAERSDNLLAGWRWSPLYSDRERAALAWTEALTAMVDSHVPDTAFADLRRHFSDPELVQLTLTIAIVNAWNRVGFCLRLLEEAKTINVELHATSQKQS
jgi:alkylhydroperoxidase family enzyme